MKEIRDKLFALNYKLSLSRTFTSAEIEEIKLEIKETKLQLAKEIRKEIESKNKEEGTKK